MGHEVTTTVTHEPLTKPTSRPSLHSTPIVHQTPVFHKTTVKEHVDTHPHIHHVAAPSVHHVAVHPFVGATKESDPTTLIPGVPTPDPTTVKASTPETPEIGGVPTPEHLRQQHPKVK